MKPQSSFVNQCRDYLERRWKAICLRMERGPAFKTLDKIAPEIKILIKDSLTSVTKSYHYVLPTQVLCKCVDSSLDCHSLQTAYGSPGAFDARTIAHGVIVPFDQANYNVLGGSSAPYVNNPLRYPAVISEYRNQQKNKAGWDKLIKVLDFVEKIQDPDITRQVFDLILIEIHHLLAEVCVVYPTPNRISLAQTIALVSKFLSEKSGGDRVEAVCAALFNTIAESFGLFDQIRREKVHAADAASGMGADIECLFAGEVVLLVEVKDRSLTLTQLDSKVEVARSRRISELLFLVKPEISVVENDDIEKRIRSEFTSGQNVYVCDFFDFSKGILILLGEKGRVRFLSRVGEELEKTGSSIVHRRAWADLLKNT